MKYRVEQVFFGSAELTPGELAAMEEENRIEAELEAEEEESECNN